jgi:hypothetical protein
MSKPKPIRTDIAWSTLSAITVKGFDTFPISPYF